MLEKKKSQLQEFFPLYRRIGIAIEKKSVKDLETIKKEILSKRVSSSFNLVEGIDHLIKGIDILYKD